MSRQHSPYGLKREAFKRVLHVRRNAWSSAQHTENTFSFHQGRAPAACARCRLQFPFFNNQSIYHGMVLHCEYEVLGLFFGSFFWLQLMFLLRFTGIRHILLFVGGCGLAILALKLQTPPDTNAVPAPGSFENWPSPEDVRELCFFCAFLFVEGLVFPCVVKFTNLTVVRPLQYIFSLLKKV